VTTRDQRWTELDRAELLALDLYRSWLCECGCGHLRADTTAFEGTGPGFVARQYATCNARLALLEEQKATEEKRGRELAPARLWTIDKR
jgi:hypothetical protein